MSATHLELVREFCRSLTKGDMAPARRYLHENVYYHNQPWEPVRGAAAVCDFLQPYIDGTHCRCARMDITHQVSEGATVMNTREELWIRDELQVVLPVAGLFLVEDDVITRWVDYWDLAAFQPLIDAISA